MVLLDNSLDEFKDSNNNDSNKQNKITISLIETEKLYIFIYKDNAGGIKIKPIEKVFEYYVSSKDKENGNGIGLAMLKMFVEDKMNSKITLENKDDGVEFNIFIPKDL